MYLAVNHPEARSLNSSCCVLSPDGAVGMLLLNVQKRMARSSFSSNFRDQQGSTALHF